MAGLAVAADAGRDYWKVGRFLQSTDQRLFRADYTTVSPRMSGHVTEVLVHDNEPVTAGHAVARIDDRDFRSRLPRQGRRRKDDARSAISTPRSPSSSRRIDQERADIASGKAAVLRRVDNVRYDDLKKSGYGTVQRAEKAETAMRESIAQLRRAAPAF